MKYECMAVGRLDENTSGLLIFTDDGKLTNYILSSNFYKIYHVKINTC